MPKISLVAGFFLTVAWPVPGWGQAEAGAFLRSEITARGAALGGAMTAVADDSSALAENPAGLARLAKPEAAGTHVTLFEDTSLDFVSAGMAGERWGGFAAGYLRQSSGGFEARASPNDAPTSFSISQSALLGGWGKAWPPLSVGVVVKVVNESIGQAAASGRGADAGLLFSPDERLTLAAMVHNLVAPRLTLVSSSVSYPRVVDVSPAYLWKLSDGWRTLLAVKFSKTANESPALSAGVELQYQRLLALRLGRQDKRLSTGVGVRFGNSSFDYAALLGDLGVGSFVTFTQRFGQTPEEIEETIRRGIKKLSYTDGARLSKAYLSKAEEELRRDRIQEALRDLEAASLLDPHSGPIRAKINEVTARWDESFKRSMIERSAALAREQDRQGNRMAGRQYWRSVLELDDFHAEAKRELARIDRELSTEERTRIEGLLQAQSAGEIALALAQASTFLLRGMPRSATLEAEKALKRFPGNAQVSGFLEQARQQRQALVKTKLAEADAFVAAKDYSAALRSLEAALREDPDDAQLAEKAAALRAQLQTSVTPEKRKEFEQLYYRAVEQYLKGGYKTADILVDELLKADPGSESAKTLKDKISAVLRYSQ